MVSLTVSILAVVGSLSLVFFYHIHSVSEKASQEAAGHLFNSAFKSIEQSTSELITHAFETAHIAGELEDIIIDEREIISSQPLRILFKLLDQNRTLYSIYFGYEDSRFFQMISAGKDLVILKQHMAPAETDWILRSIEVSDGKRVQNWYFLNKEYQVLEKRAEENPEYDPRQRPWYKSATEADEPVLSGIYMFHSLQKPGITASKKRTNGKGIVGVDLTIRQLETAVSEIRISENSRVLIVDKDYQVMSNQKESENKWALDRFSTANDSLLSIASKDCKTGFRKTQIQGKEYYIKVCNPFKHTSDFKVIAAAPVSDFNSHFTDIQNRLTRITLLWLLLFVPATYVFSRHMSNRLSVIAEDAVKMKDLIFEPEKRERSRILEFYLLEKNFDTMRSSLLENTQALEVSQEKLNRLVELGISISAERDAEELMEKMLLGARELTNADGGTLYKVEEDFLTFSVFHNETLDLEAAGIQEEKLRQTPVPLYDPDGNENHKNVVSHSIWELKSIRIDNAYDSGEYDFSGTRAFDKISGYHSKSFLTIPLMPLGGKPIGALQLINSMDEAGNIIPFSEEMVRFVEALGAQAATILYNLELIKAQKNLVDSIILLLADAIDTKSPYTGGHCKRVPELAIMMAQEACKRTDGIFADFDFKNDDDWREFSIGAWLHDCGKVVTPEYVVDKATKLETIYNRIHEIRTRFEVLLRDAKVDYYKGLSKGGDPDELDKAYGHRKSDLMEKFAFVAECNIGGEFMGEDKIQRLLEIAEEEWERNFDIRLGLSREEESMYGEGDHTLPAKEKLLADKSSHILKRKRDIEKQYADLDFKLPVPKDLYNRGELYNLSVERGTLTREERFKISEHIMQTIAMLEKMPFPSELARVPEYAGTHHETMIGTGYPRQLNATQLSIPSRIMAVADIFEALTASDRPYKEAKTLSEAIKILSYFKEDQHIDPQVFELFLTSGIYKEYGERFLQPEQMDSVDIAQYLS